MYEVHSHISTKYRCTVLQSVHDAHVHGCLQKVQLCIQICTKCRCTQWGMAPKCVKVLSVSCVRQHVLAQYAFSDQDNTEGANTLKLHVWCLCMSVLFCVCLRMNFFVDLTCLERGSAHEKSFEVCVCFWQILTVRRFTLNPLTPWIRSGCPLMYPADHWSLTPHRPCGSYQGMHWRTWLIVDSS